MRMELFKVEIKRPNRLVMGYVVAPGEQRASEIVIEHEIALNQENEGFTLEREDETLPRHKREGLDALLEHAPAGFASYCEPLGWIAHAVPVQRLGLFRIQEVSGAEHFVVAPNSDIAAAVYFDCVPLEEDDEPRMFRIFDGLSGLKNEGLRNLPPLLEAGPIGMIEWNDERGWSIKQP